jgi:hypothetical protein
LKALSHCEARIASLPEAVRVSARPSLTLLGDNGWVYRLKVMARILASRTALVGP